MDRQMNGWMNGWMDGQAETKTDPRDPFPLFPLQTLGKPKRSAGAKRRNSGLGIMVNDLAMQAVRLSQIMPLLSAHVGSFCANMQSFLPFASGQRGSSLMKRFRSCGCQQNLLQPREFFVSFRNVRLHLISDLGEWVEGVVALKRMLYVEKQPATTKRTAASPLGRVCGPIFSKIRPCLFFALPREKTTTTTKRP